jgi:hypothetical protein
VDELLATEKPDARKEYATAFQQGESEELRFGRLDAAVEQYRKASMAHVSDRLRALAPSRVVRCLEKANRGDAAQPIYALLAEQYGDQMDLADRPYALLPDPAQICFKIGGPGVARSNSATLQKRYGNSSSAPAP